eukprot:3880515-Rhodomonas_salina.1
MRLVGGTAPGSPSRTLPTYKSEALAGCTAKTWISPSALFKTYKQLVLPLAVSVPDLHTRSGLDV